MICSHLHASAWRLSTIVQSEHLSLHPFHLHSPPTSHQELFLPGLVVHLSERATRKGLVEGTGQRLRSRGHLHLALLWTVLVGHLQPSELEGALFLVLQSGLTVDNYPLWKLLGSFQQAWSSGIS